MLHLLFSDLPINAKKALIIYFAIDCDSEHFTQPAERQPTESEWQRLLQEAEQHWGTQYFELYALPLAEATAFVWDNTPDLHDEHDDFNAYHTWYSAFQMPKHTDTTWPCILYPGGDEALLDGWHRFHRYVQLKTEHIPFIRFVNDAP